MVTSWPEIGSMPGRRSCVVADPFRLAVNFDVGTLAATLSSVVDGVSGIALTTFCCSLILATSMTSKLGCWLCITSCRRDVIDDCGVISGPRVGTLLARCSCFLEQTFDARTVATECIVLESGGFVLVLLVIAGVDDLEEENFLRFFLRAAKAGPR